MYWVQ